MFTIEFKVTKILFKKILKISKLFQIFRVYIINCSLSLNERSQLSGGSGSENNKTM